MRRSFLFITLLILTSYACNATARPTSTTAESLATTVVPLTDTPTVSAPTETASVTPTETSTTTPIPSETATSLPSDTPHPTVESLKAEVIAPLLSCRYGPGPDYLYLFAFRRGAKIKLIGRVDASNWDWVLVENSPTRCWAKAIFLDIEGDFSNLPVAYPGVAKLPITPYYPASAVLSAKRNKETNEVTVSWVDVPVSLGDYEDDSMQTYIVETWRCEDGKLIFDPLATRLTFITFVDEPGCSEPSHGRVWVQEKHGYAGPAEIPWPAY